MVLPIRHRTGRLPRNVEGRQVVIGNLGMLGE